ncbi:hypothetical protein FIBSPDRAFT_902448 [Athelia psychrophila]|uniref:Uncharacterized protein n=1 Tax=Athelia psychrophila TaxID=1759441 RepID=A0A167X8D7_9AGAM|nr:hypothetical protein FIBSPDRAFT_902448 [Fibularhizoctonia sp. CBS 109695]
MQSVIGTPHRGSTRGIVENVLLCCEMLSLVKHGYLGAVGDYRGKGLIGVVPSHLRDMSDSSAEVDLLFKQSSKIDMPDGSRYFAAAASPIFPHQVRTIRGAFLPHHPFIFYVAWSAGPLDTPWLYLPAFKLYPGPGSWRKDDLSSRISLADLELPEVEIRTYHTRQWVWGDLDRNQWSYRGPEGDKLRLSYGDFIQWHNPMDRNSRQCARRSAGAGAAWLGVGAVWERWGSGGPGVWARSCGLAWELLGAGGGAALEGELARFVASMGNGGYVRSWAKRTGNCGTYLSDLSRETCYERGFQNSQSLQLCVILLMDVERRQKQLTSELGRMRPAPHFAGENEDQAPAYSHLCHRYAQKIEASIEPQIRHNSDRDEVNFGPQIHKKSGQT